ncbi:hypothetical protein [Testudinid alphaherpesvirus 3]|uniref:Uncharacterized protein n=1 Tax=Testudinid alphaherpesvirus 3 TaxID=2560801 RepID=A0A0K1R214_9ALPH|nr:hypothetical protein [Testudinid alphaherpesvirus 3]
MVVCPAVSGQSARLKHTRIVEFRSVASFVSPNAYTADPLFFSANPVTSFRPKIPKIHSSRTNAIYFWGKKSRDWDGQYTKIPLYANQLDEPQKLDIFT